MSKNKKSKSKVKKVEASEVPIKSHETQPKNISKPDKTLPLSKTRLSTTPADNVFYLTHLYAKEMSIYGDMGNIIALTYRLKKYGFTITYQPVNIGDQLPIKTDLYFMGGGQDNEQLVVAEDLQTKAKRLKKDIDQGVPLLSICGGYQLFGKRFVTGDGQEIPGIGVFDVETKAPSTNVKARCIGNVVIKSEIPDLKGINFLGFENHSGQTTFTDMIKTRPLGKVVYGNGNEYQGNYEGAVYKNAIGTYLHGSCLPKNPELADYLIQKALRTKTEKGELEPELYLGLRSKTVNDETALLTRESMINRLKIKEKK
jgi:CobQ-like glutamine amidotransferase family enzyme